MENTEDENQIGGSAVTVGDCQVWAEINYLDSATDYREYLMDDQPRLDNAHESELVMLDDSVAFFNSREFRLIKILLASLVVSTPILFFVVHARSVVYLEMNWQRSRCLDHRLKRRGADLPQLTSFPVYEPARVFSKACRRANVRQFSESQGFAISA